MTTRVSFRLLITLSFIKWPSILKLIITSLIIPFNMRLSLCLLFLLPNILQISLPKHTHFCVFDFLLANSRCFLQLHCEFVKGCQKLLIYLITILKLYNQLPYIYLFSYYISYLFKYYIRIIFFLLKSKGKLVFISIY